MEKFLSNGIALLLLFVSAVSGPASSGGQEHRSNGSAQDKFVGAWRLVWLEAEGSDGKMFKADSIGLLVFTRDGHISVQVMERNPQVQTAAGPEQYSQGGYEASFGRYEIDEDTHTFTYHVEGALVRTLVGKDLPRTFELSGKQLIVKSTGPDERWRVAWEHY